jgi:subtilisin family serine protease
MQADDYPEPSSAPKPDREATFLRLLVEAPDGDDQQEAVLRRTVRETLGLDAIGRRWRVGRLFEPIGGQVDPALTRFFEVTGHVVATPTYPLQKLGFELAYGLAARGVGTVQPDLPSSAFAPDPAPDLPAEPGLRAADASGEHLPGTDAVAWALDNIHCRDAWNIGAGGTAMGAGIVIGQPDTGFTDHPELGASALDLARDWDLLRNDDDAHDPLERRWWFPLDSPGHGTSTASAIVSRERFRVTGAAPRATLVPLRTVKSVVQVFDGDVAKAVDRAHRTGCHVISMSLGGVGFFNGLQAAIRRAVEDGVIVCAAAGNKVGFVVAPARFPECIAVAATNIQDRPWTGSSRGGEVDVAAPGESVWVADIRLNESPPRYDVSRHSGTSFAVTLVAGTAALWLARHGRDQLIARYGRNRIQATFLHMVRTVGRRRPGGWDGSRYGVGIIDAQALLAAPLPASAAVADAPAATAPSAPPDPLSKLNGLVPGLSRDELADRLGGLLGVRRAELDERLERFGAELAYLLSEDATLRGRLGATVPAGMTGDEPSLAGDLARLASPSLAHQVTATDASGGSSDHALRAPVPEAGG